MGVNSTQLALKPAARTTLIIRSSGCFLIVLLFTMTVTTNISMVRFRVNAKILLNLNRYGEV
ncbi:hypothetical protein F9Y84_05395 [Pseudoalteromonas peptidolytica]|nr:hypothetical protein [Pseudoalteromonas peptidolytica]